VTRSAVPGTPRTPLLRPGWRPDSVVSSEPFTWAVIRGFFAADTAETLLRTFPRSGFDLAGNGTPSFRFYYRPLVRKGDVHDSVRTLHESWQELAHAMISKAYASRLCELVSVPPAGRWAIDAGLCVYSANCSLKPHTDRPIRVLTQVTYLQDRWDPAWGGTLRILHSDRADDVAAEIIPEHNQSVVFVRSDSSWHAVTPVTQVRRRRRSLIFHLTA